MEFKWVGRSVAFIFLVILLAGGVRSWTGEIHGRVVCDLCGDSSIGPEDYVLPGAEAAVLCITKSGEVLNYQAFTNSDGVYTVAETMPESERWEACLARPISSFDTLCTNPDSSSGVKFTYAQPSGSSHTVRPFVYRPSISPAICTDEALPNGSARFFSRFLKPPSVKTQVLLQTRNCSSSMDMESGTTKRPTCSTCSKPERTCLCGRFQTRNLNNSVAVTILQHSAERKHPLNSARIATIGLQNVSVVFVSDVCFQSRFSVRFLDPGQESGLVAMGYPNLLGESESVGDEKNADLKNLHICVEKYGAVTSINNRNVPPEYLQMPLDQLLGWEHIKISRNPMKGFVVKKLQKTRSGGEIEEFEIEIPQGSVLLFPSERSVGLQAIDFQVKNLIVLDGTWAKARRMYNENPWLRLLPHVKLDVEKASLYSEVRHQPRPGYLSTIESVVFAMKALGDSDDPGGIDGLLDVFESMVGDQRHCKSERLKKL